LTEERQRLFSQTILKRSMSMGNLAAMAESAAETEDDADGSSSGDAAHVEAAGLQRRKIAA
jgi:hypothetical protein